MILHGIYLRSRPKKSWHLVSVAISAEAANLELETFLKKALAQGNELAEVGIKTFDSSEYIPELYNSTMKPEKALFN